MKFHWKPKLGVQSTLWDEALALQAADNDFHRRDLWQAIERRDFPEWELGMRTTHEGESCPPAHFVMDAFGHLKAIGANDAAKPLLDKAGVQPDAGVTGLNKTFVNAAGQRFWDREESLRTLA